MTTRFSSTGSSFHAASNLIYFIKLYRFFFCPRWNRTISHWRSNDHFSCKVETQFFEFFLSFLFHSLVWIFLFNFCWNFFGWLSLQIEYFVTVALVLIYKKLYNGIVRQRTLHTFSFNLFFIQFRSQQVRRIKIIFNLSVFIKLNNHFYSVRYFRSFVYKCARIAWVGRSTFAINSSIGKIGNGKLSDEPSSSLPPHWSLWLVLLTPTWQFSVYK